MLSRMNFAATLMGNQKFNLGRELTPYRQSPERVVDYMLNHYTYAPITQDVYNALLEYKLDSIIDAPVPGAESKAGGAQLYATVGSLPPPGGDQLRIGVTGQQYVWRFAYPNGAFAYDTMVVPVDTTVTLEIKAAGRRCTRGGSPSSAARSMPSRAHKLDVVPDPRRQGRPHVPRAVRRAVRAQPRQHGRARAGGDPGSSTRRWLVTRKRRYRGRQSRPRPRNRPPSPTATENE